MASKAHDAINDGMKFIFAFEEAIGKFLNILVTQVCQLLKIQFGIGSCLWFIIIFIVEITKILKGKKGLRTMFFINIVLLDALFCKTDYLAFIFFSLFWMIPWEGRNFFSAC